MVAMYLWNYVMKHLVFLLALLTTLTAGAAGNTPPQQEAQLPIILTDTFRYNLNTPSVIDIRELVAGCPKRDCIPSIDNPAFDSILNTDYLSDNDLLIVVEHDGITRAYPHKLLEARKVVNDHLDDTPVAITYCPLCASGIAFVAQAGGLVTEFGVSGMLHNSDLVLYDRRTNHLWGQITGEAIVGNNAGEKLQQIPTRTLPWGKVKTRFPRAQVLQPDTRDQARLDREQDREQGQSRYQKYAKNDRLLFPVSLKDARRKPKQLVHGMELNGKAFAVTEDYLQRHSTATQAVSGHVVRITRDNDGSVAAINVDTKEYVAITRVYWFAWYAFHPRTQLLE